MSSTLLRELQASQCDALIELNRPLTPQYTWNERFRWEKERLKTFDNWQLEWLDRNILATTGMFYLGVNDHTKCYFCDVTIGEWDRSDDPVQEHLRWSSNCPLLLRRPTDNIPLNERTFEMALPPAEQTTYDTPPASTSKNILIPNHDYSIQAVRLQSFADWPRSMKQKPNELVEAGFYYKGSGDCVVCFSCLGGLKDWEEDDDPWEQHALWLGHCCPYVKFIKGEEYIKSVYKKFQNYRPKELEEENNINRKNATELVTSSESDKLCKICFDKEYSTVYVPCGHVIACPECALSMKECPVCRATIKKVVRLYFS